jgi:hypothetical protein
MECTVASQANIIWAINRKIGLEPTVYRIGLSRTPTQRKSEWEAAGVVRYWDQWPTNSLQDAKDIESHFIKTRGMKGSAGGDRSGGRPMYVYVFMYLFMP